MLTTVGLLVSLPAGVGFAAETSNSEILIIRPDRILEDDLYAGSIRVIVEGEIDGDLVAFAAEEIVIEGTVTGSVTAVAPRVEVLGSVGGSLRAAARDVRVTGDVGRDLVAVAVSVRLEESSEVSGDVVVWASTLSALGAIGGDLEGGQRTLRVGGSVEGNVDVSVGHLEVVAPLEVGLDFGYRSESEGEGLDRIEAGGAVVSKSPLPPNIRLRALVLFARFVVVLFLSIAALAVAYEWPDRTRAAIERIDDGQARLWAVGASILLSPLALMAVAWLILWLAPASASLPLIAIMGPLILGLLGLTLVLSLVAGIPAVGWLGARLLRRLDLFGRLLVGSLVAGVLWQLPLVGWLVPLVVLPLGLGAWLSSRSETAVAGTQ